MKQFLCFLIVLILVVLVTLTVSAETYKDDELYKDEIFTLLNLEEDSVKIDYRCIYTYNTDGSAVENKNAQYALCFAHRYDEPLLTVHSEDMLGNYLIKNTYEYIPGYFVYSVNENKIYTIREAWSEKLPNMEAVLEILGTKVCLYADSFEKYLEPCGERYEKYDESFYAIEELYYYDSLSGGTSEFPQNTPEYALVRIHTRYGVPNVKVQSVCNGYIVNSTYGRPNLLQYYIYTPEDDKIYTLSEACENGIDNIDKVFTDYGLGKLIGDLDYDSCITILDATHIQRCIAKINGCSIPKNEDGIYDETSEPIGWTPNIADFDFSNEVDILDATAIQRKLAKLDV